MTARTSKKPTKAQKCTRPEPSKDTAHANGHTTDHLPQRPEHPGRGRPTIYTKELGAEICELTAMRVPLVRICELPGMPSERTIYTWKRLHPDFLQEYARAREHRADARADRIDEIAEELRTGKIDPPTARTLFDVERWQAGRAKPAVYGDRIDARLSDADGKPLQVTAAIAVRALVEAMPDLMNGMVLDGESKVLTAPVAPGVDMPSELRTDGEGL